MRPHTLVFITLLLLCHAFACAQMLTDAAPLAATPTPHVFLGAQSELPNDPGQEILPVAQAEPLPATGTPVVWEADEQTRVGDVVTLTGNVVFHYRAYVLKAAKVTYNRATTEVTAEGPMEVTGGANDMLIGAERGE